MKARSQDFLLGLVAIVMLGLIVGTVVFLRPLFGGYEHVITIQFPVNQGMAPLKEGSVVLLGGSQQVGEVQRIELTEGAVRTASGSETRPVFLVHATIRQGLPLHGGCRITTGQPAIGGNGYVLISHTGDPNTPLSEPIQGQPPQSLEAAIGNLSQRLLAEGGLVDQLNRAVDPEAPDSVLHKVLVSLDDLNAMTARLKVQLNPEQERTLLAKLHLIMDDVGKTTAALRAELARSEGKTALDKIHEALDHVDQALREALAMIKEDRPLIRDTLANVEHATRTLDKELLEQLRAEFDRTDSASALGKVHAAMDRVNTSLMHFNEVSGSAERLIVTNQPRLEETLMNFKDMSEQLRMASQEVLLNPSRLIWGPRAEREEQLLVFQAARSFAEAAGQLDDAAARLEAVLTTLPEEGAVPDAARQELESIFQAVRGAFDRFERAEISLWEQLQ